MGVFFAGVMMILIGIFHVIDGLVALFKDDFYVVGKSGEGCHSWPSPLFVPRPVGRRPPAGRVASAPWLSGGPAAQPSDGEQLYTSPVKARLLVGKA